MAFVDDILQLRTRCRISEEIGREYELSEKEIVCISALGDSGSVHSKTLSDSIGLSPSRGSRIIGRLMDRGFLECVPDPADRRYVNVRLTDQGNECLSTIERRKNECEKRLLAGLTERERNKVREGIGLLLEVI